MNDLQETLDKWVARGADQKEASREPEKEPFIVQPSDEIVSIPESSDSDSALVSVPLVRHWLFAPERSKLRYRELKIQTSHNQQKIVQTIRIGDAFARSGNSYGILKTRHQKLLFAMQDLWQKQGGRTAIVNGVRQGRLCASSWDLEQAMFGAHGGEQKRLIRAMVQQLSSIPVCIENYIGPDGEVFDLDISGLVLGAEFRTSRRRSGATQMGFPWAEIYFSSVITRAFEQQAIKPVNLRVLGQLRDIATLLYPKIDCLLASNPETEMRLDGLVEKLGLSGSQLVEKAYRRRRFQPIVKELNDQPLSKEGYSIKAKLVPTKDGRDYKLVAERKRV